MAERTVLLDATQAVEAQHRPDRKRGPVGVPVRATVRPGRELPEETASDRQQLRVHNPPRFLDTPTTTSASIFP